jgi:hypothetical protein
MKTVTSSPWPAEQRQRGTSDYKMHHHVLYVGDVKKCHLAEGIDVVIAEGDMICRGTHIWG